MRTCYRRAAMGSGSRLIPVYVLGLKIGTSSPRFAPPLLAERPPTALLRALQTALHAANFRLPGEGADEHGGGRCEIDKDEFQLRGFLKIRRETSSIEAHDPLRRIRYSFERPGDVFLTMFKGRAERSGLTWTDGRRVLAETALWHDGGVEDRDRISGRHSEGERTLVPIATMLEFLRSKHVQLIAEVDIYRYINEKQDREGTEKHEAPKHCIFILRADGTLHTMEGHSRIGEGNH